MLELCDVKKQYKMLDGEVTHALKGVSIKFRQSEFVSILGPSGCGKTTLLNIVGGLDKYSSGDLIIDCISTKNYSDRDWDTYRNHRIGFIFQSYNLIPHLNVLENVELALTLSGIGGEERRLKATEALKKVGLGNKLKSRPNQLSGGQMQRVAIARALVNDPQIILADEPTGALDSKTSVQIMELLKEISDEKLIIMVTHNPELAQNYSTRIISLLDGKVVDDTNPFVDNEQKDGQSVEQLQTSQKDTPQSENQQEASALKDKKHKGKVKKQKTKMSFWTALTLSFKNLLTKKARTLLVSFAGSIGIIGIALILSLSSGFQAYINKTQEDTLSSYPVSVQQSNTNMLDIMMSMFSEKTKTAHANDAVYGSDTMSDIFDKASSSLKANDLDAFRTYIEQNADEINKYVSGIKYTYEISLAQNSSLLNFGSSSNKLVSVYSGEKAISPKSSALMDMIVLYSMAYLKHELYVEAVDNGDQTYTLKTTEDLNPKTMDNPKYKKAYGFLSQYLGEESTEELFTTDQTTINLDKFITIISKAMGISKLMLDSYKSYDLDLFTEMLDNQKLLESQYELLGNSKWPQNKNQIMLVLGDDNEIQDYVLYALGLINDSEMFEHMNSLFTDNPTLLKVDYNSVVGKEFKLLMECDYYIDYYSDGEYYHIKNDLLDEGVITKAQYDSLYTELMQNKARVLTVSGVLRLKENTSNGLLSSGLCYTSDLTKDMLYTYNTSAPVIKGKLEKASTTPTSINFYASSFEAKQGIEDFIKAYNDKQTDEDKKIEYSDYVGLMMSSISTIISAISYVLIAFVSISLIVSSIMIGIITYISVLERTKEIGVLRSIGASKKDIKRVFVSESVIIGLVAGLLGIIVTLLLNIPINIIISALAGLNGVAKLPIVGAIVLIAISMLLTLIAGLIPARVASKKDPVIALRTE